MSQQGCIVRMIAIIIGAIIGGVVGYFIGGKSVSSALIGAAIGAVVLGIIVIVPVEVWEFVGGMFQLVECCSAVVVFFVASAVTISGFLLWHNFLLAVLAGVSSMTAMLLLLSVAAYSYKKA